MKEWSFEGLMEQIAVRSSIKKMRGGESETDRERERDRGRDAAKLAQFCPHPTLPLDRQTDTTTPQHVHATSDRLIAPAAPENLFLRGSVLRNTAWAKGVVVYAGHESKIMLNNRGAAMKRSR